MSGALLSGLEDGKQEGGREGGRDIRLLPEMLMPPVLNGSGVRFQPSGSLSVT